MADINATIDDSKTIDASLDDTKTIEATLGVSSGGGESWSQTDQSSDYTASDNDSIWADSSSNSVTITLPSPSDGARIRILNVDDTNGVDVSQNASEGINDHSGTNATITLFFGESITVESNGSTWWVV